MRTCTVYVTIFSNGSIVPTGFKFTKLHGLTLATRSYAFFIDVMEGTLEAYTEHQELYYKSCTHAIQWFLNWLLHK